MLQGGGGGTQGGSGQMGGWNEQGKRAHGRRRPQLQEQKLPSYNKQPTAQGDTKCPCGVCVCVNVFLCMYLYKQSTVKDTK